MSWVRRARRYGVVALALVCVSALVTGCSRDRGDKPLVRAAIDRTERLSRQFRYIDRATPATTEVRGVIEDDFRYKARMLIGGQAVLDEVGSDDTLADRVIDPGQLAVLLRSPSSAAANQGPVLTALATQHWVIDPVGAPSTIRSADDKRKQGDDPVYDALTVLEYVRQAVEASPFVKRFQKDALEPIYKTSEDPFPKPATGARTQRYDLKEQPLPSRSGVSQTGGQQVPTIENFRKMAIYIRDGRIIEIREVIDVQAKLKELIRNFGLPSSITVADALRGINGVRRGQGSDPIRARALTLQFTNLGQDQPVELPSDAVQGSLALLRFRGREVTTSAAAGSGQAPSG